MGASLILPSFSKHWLLVISFSEAHQHQVFTSRFWMHSFAGRDEFAHTKWPKRIPSVQHSGREREPLRNIASEKTCFNMLPIPQILGSSSSQPLLHSHLPKPGTGTRKWLQICLPKCNDAMSVCARAWKDEVLLCKQNPRVIFEKNTAIQQQSTPWNWLINDLATQWAK